MTDTSKLSLQELRELYKSSPEGKIITQHEYKQRGLTRCIVAGSRGITDYDVVDTAIQSSGFSSDIITIVSGTAAGVDRLGEAWASRNNKHVERFPADWDMYGRSAGYKRNEVMAENAEALVAVWDGKSRGTMHMIDIARAHDLLVYVHRVGS